MKHLRAIAEHLHSSGLGIYDPIGTTGNIFLDLLPESPDEVISLRTTGGMNEEYAPNWGLDSSFPSVQILVRSDRMNLAAAQYRAEEIYNAVRRLSISYEGGRIFDSIAAFPAMIGSDENGRAEYVINLQTEIN